MAPTKQQSVGLLARLKRPFLNLAKFLREVWNELQRVVWPTNEECFGFTLVVIVGVLVVAAWVGLWDLVFTRLMTLIGI
ncbi:MAG: preprotein translocase subunit SecE [Armatimonadetes bacterium]|nr:preprotein translocase subunit SecE [Armatimonadota bacterium]